MTILLRPARLPVLGGRGSQDDRRASAMVRIVTKTSTNFMIQLKIWLEGNGDVGKLLKEVYFRWACFFVVFFCEIMIVPSMGLHRERNRAFFTAMDIQRQVSISVEYCTAIYCGTTITSRGTMFAFPFSLHSTRLLESTSSS
jgi:hypothetical protein